MPTEELFGAYHFLLEVAGSEPADSFDFKAEGGETGVAMLLPAVQSAREAARRTDAKEPADEFQIEEAPPEPIVIGLLLPAVQKAEKDHGGWIDVLTVDQGINRSDGGDDFIF